MNPFIFCFIVATLQVYTVSTISVPVIIWKEGFINSGKSWSGPDIPEEVSEVSADTFGKAVLPRILKDEKKVLVFVQDFINVEDFSLYSDEDTPYKLLKEKIDTQENLYFPGVINPAAGLSLFEKKYKVEHELADNEKDIINHFKSPGHTLVYVQLPKTADNEFRSMSLRKNDEVIDDIIKAVSVVVDDFAVIFTAEGSLEKDVSEETHAGRHLLEVAEEPKPDPEDKPALIYKSKCVLAYIGSIIMKKGESRFNLSEASSIDSECHNTSSTSLTATWDNVENHRSVQILINIKGSPKSDWKINSFSMETVDSDGSKSNDSYKTKYMNAPRNFSYYCTGPSTFRSISTSGNDSYGLEMQRFQIQPLFGKDSDSFGRAYDCVGFFTVPILAGVMVSLMFAVIMYWALTMVMGIQTMDQFDDPKGPTISVPQTE